MSQKIINLLAIIGLLTALPMISNAQSQYSFSVDSTMFIFGRNCFVINGYQDTTLLETDFVEVNNDTVFFRGYQEPGQQPQSANSNYVISPLYPTVGTSWWGMYAGPARFDVQKFKSVTVPAGTFPAYIYQITDSLTGEYKGSMVFAEGVGWMSLLQIIGTDTLSLVLSSYTIVSGYGVMPISIGNEWVMIEGVYTGIDETSLPISSNYFLHQNYPNPFNPTTTISLDLAQSQFVTLKVFDVKGSEVKMLINEIMPVGHHRVGFNAGELASGLYFYQLKTEGFTQTKKMLYVK